MAGGAELIEIAESIAGSARHGEQVEAYAVRRRDLDVAAFDGSVESFSAAELSGVGVRVIRESRQGFAYAGTLDPKAFEDVFREARDNAEYGTHDDALGLISPGDFPVERLELDLVAHDFGEFDDDSKVCAALDLESDIKAADRRVRTVQTFYGDAVVEVAIANSAGVSDRQERTFASLSADIVVSDGPSTETGFGYELGRSPSQIDPASVRDEAIERATRLLGGAQPDSQRVPVVFDPFVSAPLIGVIVGTFSGEAVMKGRSIFGDRLGDEIASDRLTIVSDPTDPGAFGATAFDAEGVPTSRVPLVRSGVLERFMQNSYTARRLGATTTSSAVRSSYKSTPGVGAHSVALEPGVATFAELLGAADGGVFVQHVQGLHSGVNPISGDFSVGAEGCWIDGDQLGAPFREATIASSLQRILLDVTAVGCQVRMLAGGPAVPILVGEMTLGGA